MSCLPRGDPRDFLTIKLWTVRITVEQFTFLESLCFLFLFFISNTPIFVLISFVWGIIFVSITVSVSGFVVVYSFHF